MKPTPRLLSVKLTFPQMLTLLVSDASQEIQTTLSGANVLGVETDTIVEDLRDQPTRLVGLALKETIR